jgi:hypothetical protein
MNNKLNSIVKILQNLIITIYYCIVNHTARISAHALGFIAIVLLHFASVPTFLSVLSAKTDILPPIDVMIFIWAALSTLFVKALLEKDNLYISVICAGFIAQTVMMGLIILK